MRIRAFFWYLLAFVCVSVLLFAASNQTYAPAMLQVHVDQEKLTAAGITTLELHLTDPQGVPIEEAHVLPAARMTNMDMQASYRNVSAIGQGQYKVELPCTQTPTASVLSNKRCKSMFCSLQGYRCFIFSA